MELKAGGGGVKAKTLKLIKEHGKVFCRVFFMSHN
jgi:hypothetical protein